MNDTIEYIAQLFYNEYGFSYYIGQSSYGHEITFVRPYYNSNIIIILNNDKMYNETDVFIDGKFNFIHIMIQVYYKYALCDIVIERIKQYFNCDSSNLLEGMPTFNQIDLNQKINKING